MCMKVYDVSQHRSTQGSQHSEPMSTSSTENQTSSDKSQPKQAFSLVKLFMKQKSMSNDGTVSMEQLDRSECWPSSSGADSGESIGEQKIESKSVTVERPQIELPSTASVETQSLIYDEIPPSNLYNNRVYDEVLVEEEETVDGTKLSDSESNLYATVNKPHIKRANLSIVNSPSKMRNRRSCSSQSSATSVSISSCSESDGTQITKTNRLLQRDLCDHKATSTHLGSTTIDKSMQTSSMHVSSIVHERELFKVVEPSFLEKLKEGDCEKPVFVLYPNYTLPDISFLNGRANIYLSPLKVNMSPKSSEIKRNKLQAKGKRPFSCNDLEMLKKKGVGHIKDWDSLNFLLPMECKQLLSEIPELMQHTKEKEAVSKCGEKYCGTSKPKNRPISCDCNNLAGNTTAVSSSSSTATQPSSGYRGSSTMLTDSSAQNSPAPGGNFNPLFVYRYDSATSSEASCANNEAQRNPTIPKRSLSLADQTRIAKQGEVVPPRPPLPKSILRKSMDKTRKSSAKRYSMFEMDELIQDPVVCMTAATEHKTKRRSLQEPYYLQNADYRKNNDIAAKRLSQQFLDAADKDADYNEYYPDEGVGTESSLESGKSNELKFHRPHTPPMPKPRTKKIEYTEFPPPGALISSADLQQLEEFLKMSGFNCQNMDDWDQNQVQKVRGQVTKFLQMKRSQEENQRSTESSGSSCNSKKSVSFAQKSEAKVETTQTQPKPMEELKVASINTPPNSPNISAVVAQRLYQVKYSLLLLLPVSCKPVDFCEYLWFFIFISVIFYFFYVIVTLYAFFLYFLYGLLNLAVGTIPTSLSLLLDQIHLTLALISVVCLHQHTNWLCYLLTLGMRFD